MRGCLEYLRRSLFSRGGIRLEQTVIFLRNVMIFLKVPVGMRKIATLTMEKTVRGGTNAEYNNHYQKSECELTLQKTCATSKEKQFTK